MLCEYSHTKSESLAQIRTAMAEIQHLFSGIVFYWRTCIYSPYMSHSIQCLLAWCPIHHAWSV